jgi:hypothetical protein
VELGLRLVGTVTVNKDLQHLNSPARLVRVDMVGTVGTVQDTCLLVLGVWAGNMAPHRQRG